LFIIARRPQPDEGLLTLNITLWRPVTMGCLSKTSERLLSVRDIVLMRLNGGLRNWWAPSRSGIWGPRSWSH